MADFPFQVVAVAQRKHSSALPGKPGSSMYVSMLYVDRVHNQFLGFSALRLAVEYPHASLGSIPVMKRLWLQAETVFKVLLAKNGMARVDRSTVLFLG